MTGVGCSYPTSKYCLKEREVFFILFYELLSHAFTSTKSHVIIESVKKSLNSDNASCYFRLH
jgi:hypothetical protein